MLASDDQEVIESGDRVTLVDRIGHQSPVMVRILRAVTPRTFSARLAQSRSWKAQDFAAAAAAAAAGDDDKQSPPRIFEIVREDQQSSQQKVVSVAVAFVLDFKDGSW